MGHRTSEVADRLTDVLAGALDGVPGSTAIRGSSMDGMAYVDVTFASVDKLEAGRAAIAERITAIQASLPEQARVQIGPLASATGWVFEYVLVDPRRRQSAVALRHIQDDVLRPALAAVPGVAEIASVGGGVEQVRVELEADLLRDRSVAVSDVTAAVKTALATDPHASPDRVAQQALSLPQGAAATRIADVGRVRMTEDMPLGIADFRGVQPAVGGIVVANASTDIPTLAAAIRRTLDGLRASLPEGVELVTTYDRSDAVDDIWRTLLRSLAEEIAVVALVIAVFLVSLRSTLVIALTVPVVVLLSLAGMRLIGAPVTVMSLGGIAIALGMAIDADIVALEACHHSLETLAATSTRSSRAQQLLAATSWFAPAILTSLVIATLSFLPVLGFAGETGRLLRPLVIGKTLVIASAAIVTLTLAPALRRCILVGRDKATAPNRLTRAIVRGYTPFVQFALARPRLTLATAALAVLSCVPIASRLGHEFMPRLDEGDLLFMPTTLPGASADASATQLFEQDRALRAFPEVAAVFGKVGRADTATDPAPYAMAETVVRLAPRSRWPMVPRRRWYSSWAPGWLSTVLRPLWPDATRETEGELVGRLDEATRLPGWVNAWTAPARGRMDMMATGVRTPVGVRIVADSAARLDALGTSVRAIVARLPDTRSAAFESLGGEPRLTFTPDAAAIARFHVDPDLARSTSELLVAGGQVGDAVIDGHRLRVRVTPDVDMPAMTPSPTPLRGPADQLRAATVRASSGGPPVPLALLGRVDYTSEPSMLRTERGEHVAYVYIDPTNSADISGYVDEARDAVAAAIAHGDLHLEAGERLEWTGQYELLEAGHRRLMWILPIVVASMLGLLYLQLRSLTEALIVLASVPFALVGSVWTLYLLGYSLSAPVWVGLLSVVGLAMQTGVVTVIYIDAAYHRRVRAGLLRTADDIAAAHAEGTIQRVRPKLMTVATMAAGLLPLLWSDGIGADLMRRIAAPMIGGLATSAFLTLEVLPVLYTLWRQRQLRRATS